ncbi:MAG: DUF4026 domain-containing protein [Prevotella sp.]|nr:DUF4026 domain-containing protein [Prevotella sp.]
MKNSEKYDRLAERESDIVSSMAIIPARQGFTFSEARIKESLSKGQIFNMLSFDRQEGEENAFTAQIEYQGTEYTFFFYIESTSKLELAEYNYGNMIAKADMDKALKQPCALVVSVYFEDDPLLSFHFQLKVLNAVVPDAALVLDFASYKLLSSKWLKMTAKSDVPPSPEYLYAIHAVYNDDDENSETKQYWLHTHGLLRCGLVELEALNITDGAQQLYDLMTVVVKKFLDEPAKEREKFQIGYDGLGINLSWLRWEDAIADLPDNALGGKNDREGEDNAHTEPSGVLFAVEEDNSLASPQIYISSLADNPIYYISNEETLRMSRLAKERFPFFRDVYEKRSLSGKKSLVKKLLRKKENASWEFMVKLGLTVDAAAAETEREHLWFEVVELDGDVIEAKLLNRPYWISALNEGDTGRYPLELLTDWIIYSPEGRSYTTDSIYQLGYS